MARRRSRDFIPEADGEFAQMGRTFARNIAKDPARFFITAEDSAMITRRVAEFRDALALATATSTRTKCTVLAKQQARERAEQIVRRFGNMIRVNPNLSAADKLRVHVTERPTKLRKRTVPETAPWLTFVGSIDGTQAAMPIHVLRFKDEFGSASRAKPAGAVRLELFVELIDPDEPVPNHPGELGRPWYLRSFTRNPMHVEFPMPARPMKVIYWARWADATGNVGPWSKTCEARVEGWPTAGLLEDKQKGSRVVVSIKRRELPIIERSGDRKLLECDARGADEPRALPEAA
jgi:hypothetical protein